MPDERAPMVLTWRTALGIAGAPTSELGRRSLVYRAWLEELRRAPAEPHTPALRRVLRRALSELHQELERRAIRQAAA